MLGNPVSLISIDEARQLILDSVRPLPAEALPLGEALDRVLAEDVCARSDVPPFACSAMDGYAIHAGQAGRQLRLTGESRAGAPADATLHPGEAIRVSTGAAVPTGATAVIPQENVELEGDSILTRAGSPEGDHIRRPGEDMTAGTVMLDAGTSLGPLELGAAIAAGAAELAVARRPRVAILSTGDELREPGAPLAPGEIHNSNATMLAGMAGHCGSGVLDLVHIPDDREQTISRIAEALEAADAVVLSGGVSVGPHDHVKPALAALGVQERFWRVALQPGKPTWFGVAANDTLVFGLPGNPVSAVVTFSLFVAPALAALQCGHAPRPPHRHARLGLAARRNPQRDQAVRVTLRAAPDGTLVARPTGAQGSHRLSSLLAADALAMIPAGAGSLEAGAVVALEALVR
jgi:molybdopterin molybdotransferase